MASLSTVPQNCPWPPRPAASSEQRASSPQVAEQRADKGPKTRAQQGPHERHRQRCAHDPADDTADECQDCPPCGAPRAPRSRRAEHKLKHLPEHGQTQRHPEHCPAHQELVWLPPLQQHRKQDHQPRPRQAKQNTDPAQQVYEVSTTAYVDHHRDLAALLQEIERAFAPCSKASARGSITEAQTQLIPQPPLAGA